MIKTKRKGFTIVELVIVIAVIAILAAVLIPTFASLIRKANVSNDTMLVRNLNMALAADMKEHNTMQDALDVAEDFGYDVAKINSTSVTENEIMWDSVNDCFVYINEGKVEYIPDSQKTQETVENYKYFRIKTAPTSGTEWDLSVENYSVYLYGEYEGTVKTDKGFDAGKSSKVAAVEYTNVSGLGKDVVLRTNGGNLIVDGETDDVRHYGWAAELTVKKVSSQHCYHEFGYIGKLESFGSGKFFAESSAAFHETKDAVEAKFAESSESLAQAGLDSQYGKHYYDNGKCLICNQDDPDSQTGLCPDGGEHDWITEEIAPTCVSVGKIAKYCKKCAYSVIEDNPEALEPVSYAHNIVCDGGHINQNFYSSQFVEDDEITAGMFIAVYHTGTCKLCGEKFTEESLKAYISDSKYNMYSEEVQCFMQHDLEPTTIIKKDAYFCTGTCKICNSTQELYHEYDKNHECKWCGTYDTELCQSEFDHSTLLWTVTKEPTCTEKGRRIQKCEKCLYSNGEDISMIPHTITSFTKLDQFNHTGHCSACGRDNVSNAHDFVKITAEPFTYNNESYGFVYECSSHCGVMKFTNVVVPDGHCNNYNMLWNGDWGKEVTYNGKSYKMFKMSCDCGYSWVYLVPVVSA